MDLKTFDKDDRKEIGRLYDSYLTLAKKPGWTSDIIFNQEITVEGGKTAKLPIISIRTKRQGEAVWLVSGIHGEEPTGPNTIANNIDLFENLEKKGTPVVVLPLCNPSGYVRDWRYPNERRNWKEGRSVGDSEYLLPDIKNPTKARAEHPSCPEAKAITSYVIKYFEKYPPKISIDLHEDEALSKSYIYSQGVAGVNDPIAKRIVSLLKSIIPIQIGGKTRFDEKVVNGIVLSVNDGSIDELFASDKIIVGGNIVSKVAAISSIVVETPTINVKLSKRMDAHQKVIAEIPNLWEMI